MPFTPGHAIMTAPTATVLREPTGVAAAPGPAPRPPAADRGCAVRWFVGVITATTKRASTDPWPGSGGGRLPVEGAGLVGKFVTAHGESCSCATPTDRCLCRQRGV